MCSKVLWFRALVRVLLQQAVCGAAPEQPGGTAEQVLLSCVFTSPLKGGTFACVPACKATVSHGSSWTLWGGIQSSGSAAGEQLLKPSAGSSEQMS